MDIRYHVIWKSRRGKQRSMSTTSLQDVWDRIQINFRQRLETSAWYWTDEKIHVGAVQRLDNWTWYCEKPESMRAAEAS